MVFRHSRCTFALDILKICVYILSGLFSLFRNSFLIIEFKFSIKFVKLWESPKEVKTHYLFIFIFRSICVYTKRLHEGKRLPCCGTIWREETTLLWDYMKGWDNPVLGLHEGKRQPCSGTTWREEITLFWDYMKGRDNPVLGLHEGKR